MLLVETLSLLSARSNLLNAHLKYLADEHGAVLRRSRVRVCMHSVRFGRFRSALRASTSCEDAPRASLCQKIITRPASAFMLAFATLTDFAWKTDHALKLRVERVDG